MRIFMTGGRRVVFMRKTEGYRSRAVYLLRHGRPEFPEGEKVCLGRKLDVGLSEEGRGQARRLQSWFTDMELAVTASRLRRTRDTAAEIRPDHRVIRIDGHLDEIDMGEWEGRTFECIRKEYPDLYARRGQKESCYPPPGGETYKAVQTRMTIGMHRFCSSSSRTSMIVGHAGANRLFLSQYMGVCLDDMRSIPQEYGCVNILLPEADGWKVLAVGKIPVEVPCPDMWDGYFRYWNTPDEVIGHCAAVQKTALILTDRLMESGIVLDRGLVAAAAMLHDVARVQKYHDRVGAGYFEQMGYHRLAAILRCHHDFQQGLPEYPTEEEVVYLADKMVCKTEVVDIDERFRRSWNKCVTDEAKVNHSRRYLQAKRIEDHIESWLERGDMQAEEKSVIRGAGY